MNESWENHWKDYYQILQVHPSAEQEIITAAYRKLADKYHPDHNPDRQQWANEKFKEIGAAYETLGNAEKRKYYQEEWLRRNISYDSSRFQNEDNTNNFRTESSEQPKSDYKQKSNGSGSNKYRIVLLSSACLIVILFLTWHFAFSSTNKTSSPIITHSSSTAAPTNKTIPYSLQTIVYPVGAGTITPSQGTYANGTSLSLLATANFPYTFTNWTETDNNSFNPTMVTINTDKSVTANFKKLNPSSIQNVSDQISGPTTIATCQLNAGQWMQGEISASPDIDFRIVDGNNNTVQDMGRTSGGQFTFQAQSNGLYSLEIYGTHSLLFTRYTLSYYIYS
jgi:curved DNA-binding protein CbpA